MPVHTFHFLNVKNGDCSIIEHGSGHVSVIDVCNARKPELVEEPSAAEALRLLIEGAAVARASGARKNYNQKAHPENPIAYLRRFGIASIFRFVLTHPDMDHMDGIDDLFDEFSPANFYDTDNTKEIDDWEGSRYRESDWKFYKDLRDGKPETDPKRLTLFSGDRGKYRTKDWNGNPPGDAFYVLAPTTDLVSAANERGEYNDCSYVILYHAAGGKILLTGDADDSTWDHLLESHEKDISDASLLIAPHHGRDSGRCFDFLDVVNPKMTFFGNAESSALAYDAWRSRGLKYITNNMAGNMIVDCGNEPMNLYVSNEAFARDRNPDTWYSKTYQGWYLEGI